MVASASGAIYACGRNSHGQLGLGAAAANMGIVQTFTAVSLKAHRVVQVSCGAAHTCVITAERRLFAMGAAKHGQLGTGTTKARVRSPKEVKSLDGGALFVSAGAQHTVALGADKQLYAWGTASQSKGGGSCLGMGAGTTSVDEPEPIYDPD